LLNLRLPALAVFERAPQQHEHVLLGELRQLVQPRARQEGAGDLERRGLGRRAHQRYESVLDGREQRVLLRLVEAVDLVEEEDRLALSEATLACAGEDRPNLGAASLHSAELLERGARARRDDPCERRLAAPGRAVQDHRVGPALFDRGTKRRAVAEQVLLPDELVERGWSYP